MAPKLLALARTRGKKSYLELTDAAIRTAGLYYAIRKIYGGLGGLRSIYRKEDYAQYGRDNSGYFSSIKTDALHRHGDYWITLRELLDAAGLATVGNFMFERAPLFRTDNPVKEFLDACKRAYDKQTYDKIKELVDAAIDTSIARLDAKVRTAKRKKTLTKYINRMEAYRRSHGHLPRHISRKWQYLYRLMHDDPITTAEAMWDIVEDKAWTKKTLVAWEDFINKLHADAPARENQRLVERQPIHEEVAEMQRTKQKGTRSRCCGTKCSSRTFNDAILSTANVLKSLRRLQ